MFSWASYYTEKEEEYCIIDMMQSSTVQKFETNFELSEPFKARMI